MPVEFIENKNVLYEELVSQQYFQQDYKGSYSTNAYRNINSKNVLSVQIRLSPNKRVITRKYQSFTEILGQLGGLISISRLFGGLFFSIFQI